VFAFLLDAPHSPCLQSFRRDLLRVMAASMTKT
jgi:hypothetical protein